MADRFAPHLMTSWPTSNACAASRQIQRAVGIVARRGQRPARRADYPHRVESPTLLMQGFLHDSGRCGILDQDPDGSGTRGGISAPSSESARNPRNPGSRFMHDASVEHGVRLSRLIDAAVTGKAGVGPCLRATRCRRRSAACCSSTSRSDRLERGVAKRSASSAARRSRLEAPRRRSAVIALGRRPVFRRGLEDKSYRALPVGRAHRDRRCRGPVLSRVEVNSQRACSRIGALSRRDRAAAPSIRDQASGPPNTSCPPR
jgi:hypothetical protein